MEVINEENGLLIVYTEKNQTEILYKWFPEEIVTESVEWVKNNMRYLDTITVFKYCKYEDIDTKNLQKTFNKIIGD